jgi:pimeloyl-ACP methyl ester carboxylesterase
MQKKTLLGALLAIYLVSIVAALANPGRLQAHQVSLSMQSATLATLALMVPILGSQKRPATSLLAVLAASLVARLVVMGLQRDDPQANLRAGMARWDAFATYIGLLGASGLAAYELGGTTFAILLVLLGLPLVVMLPKATTSRATVDHAAILRKAADWSGRAYGVSGLGEYVADRGTGALAGVAVDEGDTYVFFSGTTSATDWIRTNTDARLDALPDTWTLDCLTTRPSVHRGFLKAYTSVRAKLWGKILEAVLRVGGSGRIIVCGHSLGGAMATVAALDLACRLDPIDAAKLVCITFGAPQVGDGLFVEAFNAKVPLSLRVATVYDPVPKVFSAQLPHVDGLVPLPSPPMLQQAHALDAYRIGLQQRPWQNVAVMLAPMVFLIVASVCFARHGHRLVDNNGSNT